MKLSTCLMVFAALAVAGDARKTLESGVAVPLEYQACVDTCIKDANPEYCEPSDTGEMRIVGPDWLKNVRRCREQCKYGETLEKTLERCWTAYCDGMTHKPYADRTMCIVNMSACKGWGWTYQCTKDAPMDVKKCARLLTQEETECLGECDVVGTACQFTPPRDGPPRNCTAKWEECKDTCVGGKW